MIGIGRSIRWTLLAAALAMGEDKPTLDLKPMRFGGSQEFGSVSRMLLTSNPVQIQRNEWIDHFGVYFLQEATVDGKVDLSIGLGGVFQFPKPETVGERFGGSQYKLFYQGPAVAQALYKFGNPDQPVFTLGGGMFPYKYNPEAFNLGEYLFRAKPYPTYIMTGGLNVVNDNAAYLEGFMGKMRLGNFQLDVLLPTETGMPPFYDWSLAAVGRYTTPNGLLDLGLGVNFNRLLQVRPSRTSRKEAKNSYFTRNGVDYTGNAEYYTQHATFFQEKGDTVTARSWTRIADSVTAWRDSTGIVPGSSFYTFAGTTLMGRGTLALNRLFGWESLGENDLKIYLEAALLGTANYPVFYENPANRLPIMAGVNLPAFKFLDLLAVQVEYFNGNFINSTYSIGQANHAIPYIPNGTSKFFSTDEYLDITKEDNFSWTVLATKSIYKTFSISAQVARDHLRTIGTDWFYGSRYEPNEAMRTSKDWYWMLQFGWKI